MYQQLPMAIKRLIKGVNTVMKITVEVKTQWGNEEVVYPVCKTAKLFAALAGTRTLTPQARTVIKQLGYAIEPILPSYNL